MPSKRPTEDDRLGALRRLLAGLAAGDEVPDIAGSMWDLHPKNDTFPGEVFMALARDAMDLALAAGSQPLEYEDLRNRYLEDCGFRGRQNQKIKFAILATAAGRGGVEPDLLDEIVWWGTDDFWSYALAGSAAIIRACADRLGLSIPELAAQLANGVGIDLAASSG